MNDIPKDIPFDEPVDNEESIISGLPQNNIKSAVEPPHVDKQLDPSGIPKDIPFDEPVVVQPPQDESFLGTLKNPWTLWTEESVPARLKSAYDKGVFDKPIGELVKDAGDAVKDFKVSDVVNAAKNKPGKFMGELVNAVVADPYLLLPVFWEALGGRLATAGAQVAGRVGAAAGRAVETGLTGAGVAGGVSAAKQLDEAGFIDPGKLAQEMGIGAGLAAGISAVGSIAGAIKSVPPKVIQESAQFHIDQGDTPMQAVMKALKEHGVDDELAAKLTEPVEVKFRDEAALEKESAAKRIESGEAQAVGEEPSALQAKADFLASKRSLTPSEAKEYQDIKSYLEVLPDLGATPKESAAMTPSQAKAFVEARVGDAPLDVAAKVEAPKLKLGETSLAMKQRGIQDPEMSKWIALGLGGAAIGGYLSDDKAKGAAIGAALLLGGPLAVKAGRAVLREGSEKLAGAADRFAALKRDPAKARQIDEIISGHEALTASVGLASDRLSYMIKKLVPDAAKREELIHVIQEGRVGELSGNERAAAELFQKEMAEFGDAGQKAGVLDDLIDDGTYVTQLWDDEAKAKGYYSAMKGATRFAEDRLIPSYKEGMALGLKPKTLDIADIANIYGRNLGRAMANKELIETLKKSTTAGTEKLGAKSATNPVMPSASAPADYVTLPHPQLTGFKVNPDMAPSLSFLFHANNIPSYLAAATAVSSAAKQGLLGLSAFHLKSLLEVGLGMAIGLGSPKTLTKIPEMYRMLRNGAAGDFVDQAVQAGLKIDAHGFDMDSGVFAKLADSVVDGIEKIPVAGKAAALPVKGIRKLAEANNWLLWEYIHPSIKLSTANAAYTRAMEKEAAMAAKDASYQVRAPQAIMKEVAATTNDLFGGLNWRGVTDEIQNKVAHQLMASLTNQEGLRMLRVGLLAPDWLASTLRAGYKGIKATGKSLIPGTKLSVAEDMYRRYFLGGALMTATVMEGLQQNLTGTHFWDNPDPTYVYLPDGRKIQVAKHFTEIFHWLMAPGATFVNKLGYVPKEAVAQLLDKEYISAKGSPPMEDTSIVGRAKHAAKGMLPIGVQEASGGRMVEGLSGALGVPIHGRTREERMEQRRKRAEKKRSAEGQEEDRKARIRRQQMRRLGGD